MAEAFAYPPQPMADELALNVNDLSVAYHQLPVLWSVHAQVPLGSLTAVVGPNGAGKSTFIKTCLGLQPRLSGTIQVFGRTVRQERQRIAYVPQRSTVDWDFPVSTLEVVAMGRYGKLGWFRRVGRRDQDIARHCLAQVGMVEFADRQIGQLSGGQQQRVFLARALAQEADLYFMDEPFAGVDAATERAILEVLHSLKAQGKTLLCVHHDLDTVAEYFERVLILNVETIAQGPVASALTEDAIQRAYGQRHRLLRDRNSAEG